MGSDGVEFVVSDGVEAVEDLSKVSTLLKLLSSKVVLKIIGALSVGELSPRQIAEVTGTDESVVSRKLRRLKEYGLVKYSWVRYGDRNLKVYRLTKKALTLMAGYPTPRVLLNDLGMVGEECREEANRALVLSYDAPPFLPRWSFQSFYVGSWSRLGSSASPIRVLCPCGVMGGCRG